MNIDTILNVILVILVTIVVVHTGISLYTNYLKHKLNMAIISLYREIPHFNTAQIEETNRALSTVEGIAIQRYIDTARLLLAAREHMLRRR